MNLSSTGVRGQALRQILHVPAGVARQVRLVRRSPSEMTLARLLVAYRLARLREAR